MMAVRQGTLTSNEWNLKIESSSVKDNMGPLKRKLALTLFEAQLRCGSHGQALDSTRCVGSGGFGFIFQNSAG